VVCGFPTWPAICFNRSCAGSLFLSGMALTVKRTRGCGEARTTKIGGGKSGGGRSKRTAQMHLILEISPKRLSLSILPAIYLYLGSDSQSSCYHPDKMSLPPLSPRDAPIYCQIHARLRTSISGRMSILNCKPGEKDLYQLHYHDYGNIEILRKSHLTTATSSDTSALRASTPHRHLF
jgi:hypothetical protein